MNPLQSKPLVVRRSHPGSRRHIDHLVTVGQLVPLLPGVYRWAGVPVEHTLLARAASLWKPTGTLLGASAAALTWWPELSPQVVDFLARAPERAPEWLRCRRLRVPEQLVRRVGEVRVAGVELSVLGMVDQEDGFALCEALRRRVTTQPRLERALGLMPRTWGQPIRRKLVMAAEYEPWSPLELQAHQMLREAGLRGWESNYEVRLAGRRYFLDIAFPEFLLAVELDGWEYHRGHAAFVADRERQNQLMKRGWTVLRYTADTLGQLVADVRAVLTVFSATLGR